MTVVDFENAERDQRRQAGEQEYDHDLLHRCCRFYADEIDHIKQHEDAEGDHAHVESRHQSDRILRETQREQCDQDVRYQQDRKIEESDARSEHPLAINVQSAGRRHCRTHEGNRQLLDHGQACRQHEGKRNCISGEFDTDADQYHDTRADHLPQGNGKYVPEAEGLPEFHVVRHG